MIKSVISAAGSIKAMAVLVLISVSVLGQSNVVSSETYNSVYEAHRDAIAVVIGNRDYKGETPKVDYAINDATSISQMLQNRLGYRVGNIIDLRNATLNDMAAVLGNERAQEGKLHDWIRPGQSDVFVFYSGHGVPGLKDKRPYLLPVDGDANRAEITGYPLDVLYRNLAKLPAKSVTVFIDACFSGDSPKGMIVKSASGISLEAKLPKSAKSMTVITAAQGDQLASWDEKAKHGLFTKHLLEALEGKADSKRYGNEDGKVSLDEVRNYLDQEMTYQARRLFGREQRASVSGSDDTVIIPKTPNKPIVSHPGPGQGAIVKHSDNSMEVGATFRDCAACPEMVVIWTEPELGSVSAKKSFAVGKFEVTFDEWQACLKEGGCSGYLPDDLGWGRGRRPVINLDWNDAQSYLKWISVKTGRFYRLPTNAEWEYAARAGSETKYHNGNTISLNEANYKSLSTVEVGNYAPNSLGLFDTLGNVWEWVEDCGKTLKSTIIVDTKQMGGECYLKYLRGGSWKDQTWLFNLGTEYGAPKIIRYPNFGMRVARSLN
jgi:formylglycine-generating enzyme required for sulfatase activity